MENTFAIGDPVLYTPKDKIIGYEFLGTIVGFRDHSILIEDQDGDVFHCDPECLSHEN